MLDVLAAIGIGAVIGTGARALKDGVIFNPGRRIPETLDAISKRNDKLLEGVEWDVSKDYIKTYKCFSKGE